MEENPHAGKRKRTFVDKWLTKADFQPWLEKVNGDECLAWCSTCSKSFKAEITTIKRHEVNTFKQDYNMLFNFFI